MLKTKKSCDKLFLKPENEALCTLMQAVYGDTIARIKRSSQKFLAKRKRR
jgi:hypothetical protein